MIKNIFVGLVLCLSAHNAAFSSDNSIRLGWQVPWATQGQLVMGLKYTNITELTNIDIEYAGFSYGGPLNKAALGGQVDILLTADQPAMVLVSRNPDFRIVARMMYNRVCIYVPPESSIDKLNQLTNKSLFGPIGAAAERVALAALKHSGVDTSTMQIGQLDMAQQAALVRRHSSSSQWPGIDALFGFDPLPAIFSARGEARMLNCGKVVSVVVAHKDMLENRRDTLLRFIKAFKSTWYYFSRNPGRLNRLFSRDSELNVSDAVLDEAASIEPNRWVENFAQLRFDFQQSDFEVFGASNRFLLGKGILKQAVDMHKFVDLGIVKDPNSQPSVELLENIILTNQPD